MAAPSATARQDPVGIFLENGHRTLITFAADPDLSLWEKVVSPFPWDGGEAIDITTMHNDDVRTKAPRALIDNGESSYTCAYDPAAINQIMALLNVKTTITETLPDGSTLAYYGFLRMFERGDLQEGEFPEGTATIVPTNWDPTNHVEALPVLTSVAGT